jgi:hypothetical protein
MPKRILIILTCCLPIAACGSSGKPSNTKSASRGYPQALQFSKCMRSHGVPNFPDPTPGSGGGVQLSIGPSSGVNPQSPAFKSAQQSCQKLLPGGGPGSGPPSAEAKAQMLKVSQCMRAHGISGFPDPTTSDPTTSPQSSPAGSGQVWGRDGVFLAIPNTIDTNSPAFKQAATACKFGGPGAKPAGG